MADDFDELKRQPDTITVEADPLKLELDDETLVRVIDDRIRQSKDFFDKNLKFKERRDNNKRYLLGDHPPTRTDLKYYQPHYVDNLIYEAESTIKPIALSRLPDLLVKAGNDTDMSKEIAKDLTKVVNSDLRKRENRRVLGLSFKHLPVYYTGIIKAVWDPQLGDSGDYRFKIVHPDNIVVDHTASDNESSSMDFIAEAMEVSIKEVLMMFPKKEKELLNMLVLDNKLMSTDDKDEKRLASKIKIWEVWFTWWNAETDIMTGEKKWERIEAVVWKYKDLVLGKMKNPYWDWQGKKRLFKYEMGEKNELTDEELREIIFGADTVNYESEMFYFNHFRDPQKPYFFMGYNQWGEHPFDVTSRIEQVIPMQDNVNKRGRQITEMNDRAKGKHVFSTDSGLEKEDIEDMDMDNPDEDLVIDGDITRVHTYIQGEPAPAALFQEQSLERQKVFAKMGTHSTTRGEREPGSRETATGRQLLKESDFGRIDDLVEETVNPAAEWIANWAMQFIKLFYTKTHMKKLLGRDGEVVFTKITRDSVEDGMEVVVSASGVDKRERAREAFLRARMKLTDPLQFFIDTDASDPIGRTEKLMVFLLAPELYLQKYVKKRSLAEMITTLQQQPIQGQSPPPNQQAPQPQQQPQGANLFGVGGGDGQIKMPTIDDVGSI